VLFHVSTTPAALEYLLSVDRDGCRSHHFLVRFRTLCRYRSPWDHGIQPLNFVEQLADPAGLPGSLIPACHYHYIIRVHDRILIRLLLVLVHFHLAFLYLLYFIGHRLF